MQVDTLQPILDYPDDDGNCAVIPFSYKPDPDFVPNPDFKPGPDGAPEPVPMVIDKPLTFRIVARNALNAAIDPARNPSDEEKDLSYELTLRVSLDNPCELSTEKEIPHILRSVGRAYGPLVRGRCREILDPKRALAAVESITGDAAADAPQV